MTNEQLKEMKAFSAAIRIELLKQLKWRRYGHLGGAMSIVELLSVLYKSQLKHKANDPGCVERDYLVLSKGHSAASLYCALMLEGYFGRDLLYTMNEGGTSLPSHPDRLRTPGIDATTGSLGQGTSIAAGMGMALKKLGRSDQYVYLIIGDGELNEGQCWEAFQFIASYNLANIITFIDNNKKQLDGYLEDIIKPQNISEKMRAFGFNVIGAKGDDEAEINSAVEEAKREKNMPSAIILDTVKGQGVKYFEQLKDNHSVKFNAETDRQADMAIGELEKIISPEESLNVE